MAPLELLNKIYFSGPNEDGEYWLHFKAGGNGGGMCLGHCKPIAHHIDRWEAERGRIIQRGSE